MDHTEPTVRDEQRSVDTIAESKGLAECVLVIGDEHHRQALQRGRRGCQDFMHARRRLGYLTGMTASYVESAVTRSEAMGGSLARNAGSFAAGNHVDARGGT